MVQLRAGSRPRTFFMLEKQNRPCWVLAASEHATAIRTFRQRVMPRFARRHCPGALVHVIVRFTSGEHRLAGPAERAIVLARLPAALARTDWTLHAYALMGSHIHLAMTAGRTPPARFLRSLLVSVAYRLNRAHGRTGPVVAERAKTVLMAQERMATLVAYLHNNPVRAGVVATAGESDWTSHRAWTDQEPVPPWLTVTPALERAGYEPTSAGRRAFDQYVRERASDPRDPILSGRTLHAARTAVRADLALPVEVSSPMLVTPQGDAEQTVLHGGLLVVAPRWGGDLNLLVERAALAGGCSVAEIRARTHRRPAVEARRVVMVTGAWLFRRRITELAAALAISCSSASRLLRRGARVLPEAQQLESALRAVS
jgi:hypothetical protein